MKAISKSEQPFVSPGFMKMFARYCRGYVGRHFHALRILKAGLPPQDEERPLIIYLNHASWWDPLVCLLLARELFPSRESYAPIEAGMLKRYSFFKRIGFFGIEPGTVEGALKFLRTAKTMLSQRKTMLWMTPQGRFMDVRERPLRLEAGLGALAVREKEAMFVPLAIEFSFWTEPRPEILVSFGEPIIPAREDPRSTMGWTRVFTDALENTQDELATRSCRRDASEWITLNPGKAGLHAIYDAWRWLRARVRGEKFGAEHHSEAIR